jgi:hypothetical protein
MAGGSDKRYRLLLSVSDGVPSQEAVPIVHASIRAGLLDACPVVLLDYNVIRRCS